MAAYGHTYPVLPLAIAAREAGHEVSYAIADRFHPLVRRLGFTPVSAGTDPQAAAAELFRGQARAREELTWQETLAFGLRVLTEAVPRRVIDDLLPALQKEPADLVVYDLGNPGAALVAHHLGIPAVAHSFGRANLADDVFQASAEENLGRVAAAAGLALPSAPFPGFGDRYLDIYPPSLQDPAFLDEPGRVPLRPVAFAEPGDLPGVVRASRHRPLVYLTLGTTAGTLPALRSAIDGLSALDADVLVAAGPAVQVAELGELPPGVRAESWLPQADVLPHADLVVHHAGSGTALGAAAAGVPQLFLPTVADQFANADAFSAAGVGAQLLPEGVTRAGDRRRNAVVRADSIADSARRLLADTQVREAARRLAAEIAALPGPAEIAARLPGFTGS